MPAADARNAVEKFFGCLEEGYACCGGAGRRPLLAVSGGSDSVALLTGSVRLLRSGGSEIHVAHVNHGLRGRDSDADAEFVRHLAAEHGLPVFLLSADVRARQQAGGSQSLEETARRMRYQLLTETAAAQRLDCVVTAHHQDDQAETIVHHILRGTGLRGLQGMALHRPLGQGIPLLRPLLHTSRQTILDYLTCCRIPWCTDASNTDTGLTRNRIRHELLPLLQRDFSPQITRRLTSLGHQAGEAVSCLDQLADRVLTESVLERTPDIIRLDRSRLITWPVFLIRHTLCVIWAQQDWPRQKMTSAHWTRMAGMIRDAAPRSRSLPGTIELSVNDRLVRLIRGPGTSCHDTLAEVP